MSIKALRVTTTGEVRDIDLAGNELQTLQEAVGGFVEAVQLSDRLTLFCNEEGRILQLPFNPFAQKVWERYMDYMADVIVGDVVIAGGVDDDGNTVSLQDDELTLIAAFLLS
jgi:hypothetical protein